MGKKLYNKVDKRVLKENLAESKEPRITLSFYQYAHIPNPMVFRNHMYSTLEALGVFGRIYVAKEGINGQISVAKSQFEAFKQSLDEVIFLQGIRLNIAIEDDGKSFYKLIIKVKEKIVADGLNDENFDVTDKGIHLGAEEFNALAEDPNTIIVDMRNHYESEVGHFKDAFCPDVDTFREALKIVEDELEDKKDKNIVMYCTGGIRCEKASAYYKHKGFQHVYQLNGGIIEYARQVNQKGLENKYIGKNFVFDDRLGERISEDIISKCHQCGDTCDSHTNCANDACHLLFIQCTSCAEKNKGCCSDICVKYVSLPKETQKELRMGITDSTKTYSKARISPFLENKALQEKVNKLYQDMIEKDT